MTGLGRRTRGHIIEKWDQTGSPEIPDRGEDIRNPLTSLRGMCSPVMAFASLRIKRACVCLTAQSVPHTEQEIKYVSVKELLITY